MPVVTDYTALLYYPTYSPGRWNAQADIGTQAIVTYSFTDTPDLQSLADYDPYGATAYWAYSEAQRTLMREVIAQFEAVSGVRFVEIEGDSMINVFGADVSGVGGWANIPFSTQNSGNATGNGNFVNAYQNMSEGDYGYQVNLHELGHALGLQHPHEGTTTLDPSVDTQANTVMTYNIGQPYATELGVFDIQAMEHIYGSADQFDNWVISANAADTVTIRAWVTDDVILGTDQNNIIFGFGGNDEIIGREGNDKVQSGNGNDTIVGAGGDDSLFGGNGDDLIFGAFDDNTFSGEAGAIDRLFGNTGNDTIYGGEGADRIYGGLNDDLLIGGHGVDRLYGSTGEDTLDGGAGSDRMLGGGGADTFFFEGNDANERDYIFGFELGIDKIDISSIGFTSIGQLTIEQRGAHADIKYGTWFEVTLVGRDASLIDSDDFIFA